MTRRSSSAVTRAPSVWRPTQPHRRRHHRPPRHTAPLCRSSVGDADDHKLQLNDIKRTSVQMSHWSASGDWMRARGCTCPRAATNARHPPRNARLRSRHTQLHMGTDGLLACDCDQWRDLIWADLAHICAFAAAPDRAALPPPASPQPSSPTHHTTCIAI